MENNYKKIEFGQDGTLVTNEPAVTVEVQDEALQEAIPTPDAPVADAQAVQEVQKDVKRRSRAKERIEQLVSKQREVEEMLNARDQELADLRKQLEQNTKLSKEDLKTSLERQVMSLSRQLADYTRSGDVDKAVEAQDQLIDAKVKLSQITSEMAGMRRPESVQPTESPRPAPPAKLPPLAQQWIEEHPEFKTDAIFHAAALVINNQLVNEGFDHNQEDFWDELSDRLSPRFPEVFGIEQESSVQLSKSNTPSHETNNGQQDVNNQAARAPVQSTATPQVPPKSRTTEQTVSSSSRPASPSIQQPNKGTSVEFTQAEAAQAEAWQIPLETMARRIVHQEKNKRADGYTEIMIPKKGNH